MKHLSVRSDLLGYGKLGQNLWHVVNGPLLSRIQMICLVPLRNRVAVRYLAIRRVRH